MTPLSIALLAAIFVGLPLILAHVGATIPDLVRAWPECFTLDEAQEVRASLPRVAAKRP